VRALLAEWARIDTVGMDATEIARIAVEKSLITTHRSVFGVFFWFLMPAGPACAVLYRVSEYLARAWNEPEHMRNEAFGQFAAKAFYWIDWIPVRLTAIAFAVVGNFEDAIYAWRNFADRWADESRGIILAAGGGAMGVRLGTPNENAPQLLPPRAVDQPVRHVDVMPTLLGLCGLPVPKTVEGFDFTGYLRGGKDPSGGGAIITCVTPFGEYSRVTGGREYRGLRTRDHTYVRDLNGPWLLFDHAKDPWQLNNLVGKPESAALQAKLEAQLTQKLAAQHDAFLPGPDYIAKWKYKVNARGTVDYTN